MTVDTFEIHEYLAQLFAVRPRADEDKDLRSLFPGGVQAVQLVRFEVACDSGTVSQYQSHSSFPFLILTREYCWFSANVRFQSISCTFNAKAFPCFSVAIYPATMSPSLQAVAITRRVSSSIVSAYLMFAVA